MKKKELIKLQYERDGTKPAYLTDGSRVHNPNQLLYVAFRGRGGRVYYTRKRPSEVKEDLGKLDYTDVTNRKRLAWEVEEETREDSKIDILRSNPLHNNFEEEKVSPLIKYILGKEEVSEEDTGFD